MRPILTRRRSATRAAVVCLAMLAALIAGTAGFGPAGEPGLRSAATCSHTAAPFCWPASVSANGRYLLDQTGRPYLIVGDAPQDLIGELSGSQAGAYFADRQAHGINSAWINLLCTSYTGCGGDGRTYDGIAPFNGTSSDPFANPNPDYFQRADDMINLAAAHGLTVFLDPAETGGWLNEIDQAGAANDFSYGVYLGNRYKNYPNVIWLSGNDFQSWSNSNDDANVRAIARGIESVDTHHIQTVELNYQASSSLDDPSWAPLIKLNFSYTYFPTYAEVLHAYNQSPTVPVFMGEANYENEDHDGHETGGPYVLRLQEYWTMTSGATGQLYGNHVTWDDGTNWADESAHLDTAGAAQLGLMEAFFRSLPWYTLVPDQAHQFVTGGYGTFASSGYVQGNDYVTAALAPDGTTGVVYLPTSHTITVNLTRMSGSVMARWFDPTDGHYTAIGTFANSGTRPFSSPPAHSDGFDDWVLLLQTTSSPAATITPAATASQGPTPAPAPAPPPGAAARSGQGLVTDGFAVAGVLVIIVAAVFVLRKMARGNRRW